MPDNNAGAPLAVYKLPAQSCLSLKLSYLLLEVATGKMQPTPGPAGGGVIKRDTGGTRHGAVFTQNP